MGEAEINRESRQLIIHSVLFFYGNAANELLSGQIAKDIATHWNEPNSIIRIKGEQYLVYFDIEGIHAPSLTPETVFENDDPRNNYFRIEEYAHGNVSFVDG